MSTITDPVVINFSNQYLRPSMDTLAGAARTAAALTAIYQAQGIAARCGIGVAGTDMTQVIGDGSPQDGRVPISLDLLARIMGGISIMNTWATAADNNTLQAVGSAISGISSNGVSFQAMCLSIAVNPSPKF